MCANRPLSGTMIISEVGTSGPPPPGAAPGIPGMPAGAPGPFSAAIIMSNLKWGEGKFKLG